MVSIVAKVRRCGHNSRLVSIQMWDAEPHVLRFIGDGGAAITGEDRIQAVLRELMENGYPVSIQTEYEDVSPMEYLGVCG